ncbi:MAG TPA: iron ABC transporter permease [Geminicoccaceae bacterium]|nr:iron ABC transporter permease [Geminicoccaceae bacterium]
MARAEAVAVPRAREERVRQWSARDPLLYVHLAVILLLCGLIVYPAAILLERSFRDDGGAFSLMWYVQAYTNERNLSAIVNTIIVASGAAALAAVSGTLLAWAVVRTDMPGRRLVEMASIVPFISTSFIGALAWILLGSPETGLINQFWRFLGNTEALIDIYSIEGIIFVIALYEMPFVFLLVGGALRSMDPALEEASLSAGAGLWRTTTRVTLPLVLPAILASSLLVFVLAAEQFGVPAVLGTPARIRVLTTSIVATNTFYPPQHGLGAALCVTLLIIALLGLWLQRRALAGRSFTTVGGKGSQPRRIALGPFRWLLLGICCAYLLLAVVLPFSTIFLSSIRTLWTADFRWEQFTLEHYRWILFEYPITVRAIRNSLFLAVVGATVTILLCALISFLSLRTRLPGRNVLDYLSMLPLGFPGVVLAYGLLQAWINPPLVLYGTIWILFIAYMTRYLPIGVRSTSATLVQIHPELEESSLACGASWLQTFKNVTLPLLRPGIVAGWILLFIAFSRELSASVLLYAPGTEVLSVVLYDLQQNGQFREISALAFIQIAASIVLVLVAKWLAGLDRTPEA